MCSGVKLTIREAFIVSFNSLYGKETQYFVYHKYIELFNAMAVTDKSIVRSIFVVHDHVDGKFNLDRKGVPGSTVKK